MDESTSWKGQSFTLLIFGGIVVLVSIFFVLGMLVGRTQGQRIAELAFAEQAKRKPQAVATTDNFKLDFYSATTEEKPDLKLEPAKEPPPSPAPERPANTATPGPARAAAAPAKSKAKDAPAERQVYFQVFSSSSDKQAKSELKRVESKQLKAKIVDTGDGKLHRVVVGPYRASEVDLVKSDLRAKGFKDAFPMK